MSMSTGELARKLGVSTRTVILWEHRGLVNPKRSAAGWRVYADSDVSRLVRLLRTKQLRWNKERHSVVAPLRRHP